MVDSVSSAISDIMELFVSPFFVPKVIGIVFCSYVHSLYDKLVEGV